ncbi:F0F1 ATP synthase subunit delta [Luteipulveratus sp. YIM 133132]|uniref:F0F1 ATP synthase subunit delta n=1 Tax=Luteipulveratus flavus TaxID=3031728 RepID=UPI0023AFDAA3|nr:F0F1 ATP synthase subunit delta [Luteipulveratus sp. YIM 133132]MDE9365943.1 F0F1 ATP synthase subunit delta [Luteipulveratus sp. YIM 133132]
MQGPSRAALAQGRDELGRTLASVVDPAQVGEELFFVGQTLDSSASLRRAAADPSREVAAKQQLVERLFGGRVSEQTVGLVRTLVAQRWSAERDLAEAVDLLAVESVVAGAEQQGRIDQVEDDLFRFSRTVSGDAGLRDAYADRQRSGADKATLTRRLLEGKAAPESVRLAAHAAEHPRGRRFEKALESYVGVATRRREQLTALVTTATSLDESHQQRLQQALSDMYGKPVQINVVRDPEVVGGIRVQIGDEVIDGTIARRLDEARRGLAG